MATIDGSLEDNIQAHVEGKIELSKEEFMDILFYDYSLINKRGEYHPQALKYFNKIYENNKMHSNHFYHLMCLFEDKVEDFVNERKNIDDLCNWVREGIK